jgi:hypothetical protein
VVSGIKVRRKISVSGEDETNDELQNYFLLLTSLR